MTEPNKASLKTLCQYAVPHHLISRIVGKIGASTLPWVKQPFINWFINRYGVDMSEARVGDPTQYAHFNAFFTRELAPGLRPIDDQTSSIVSPADGAISQIGRIESDNILQAKGHHYSVSELLGGCSYDSRPFMGGHFATVYLSPKDYHRVHMPYGGRLKKMIHVPGRLFSVNTRTADELPNLFARNERVVCLFDTDLGPMAVVLVGAMIVASIETVWSGVVAPKSLSVTSTTYTENEHITLNKGDEMGRFALGSTAIVLFGPNAVDWSSDLTEASAVRMGSAIGHALVSNKVSDTASGTTSSTD